MSWLILQKKGLKHFMVGMHWPKTFPVTKKSIEKNRNRSIQLLEAAERVSAEGFRDEIS